MSHRPLAELAKLVGVMAHDLKNPLAALITNLSFVRDRLKDQIEPDVDEAVVDSVALCEVLERFTNNLDLLARAEQLAPRLVRFPLQQIAEELVAKASPHAEALGVRLRCVLAERTLVVEADRDLLLRAGENVLASMLEQAVSGTEVIVQVLSRGSDAVLDVTAVPPPTDSPKKPPKPPLALKTEPSPAARYGRGLSLVCADIAAHASGARVERKETSGHARPSSIEIVATMVAS